MAEVRVLLLRMPHLLEELVRAMLAAEPGTRVVDEPNDAALDVVVMSLEDPAADAVTGAFPAATIVMLTQRARAGLVARPIPSDGELSPAALTSAIRAAAAGGVADR